MLSEPDLDDIHSMLSEPDLDDKLKCVEHLWTFCAKACIANVVNLAKRQVILDLRLLDSEFGGSQ